MASVLLEKLYTCAIRKLCQVGLCCFQARSKVKHPPEGIQQKPRQMRNSQFTSTGNAAWLFYAIYGQKSHPMHIRWTDWSDSCARLFAKWCLPMDDATCIAHQDEIHQGVFFSHGFLDQSHLNDHHLTANNCKLKFWGWGEDGEEGKREGVGWLLCCF